MKSSDKSKVLHPVGGLPMVAHMLCAQLQWQPVSAPCRAWWSAADADEVENAAVQTVHAGDVSVHLQAERLGTAHAVLAARAEIAKGYDDLIIMFGDTPLVDAEALWPSARVKLADGAMQIVVMGFRPADPTGYGRLVEHDRQAVCDCRGKGSQRRPEKDQATAMAA